MSTGESYYLGFPVHLTLKTSVEPKVKGRIANEQQILQ